MEDLEVSGFLPMDSECNPTALEEVIGIQHLGLIHMADQVPYTRRQGMVDKVVTTHRLLHMALNLHMAHHRQLMRRNLLPMEFNLLHMAPNLLSTTLRSPRLLTEPLVLAPPMMRLLLLLHHLPIVFLLATAVSLLFLAMAVNLQFHNSRVLTNSRQLPWFNQSDL